MVNTQYLKLQSPELLEWELRKQVRHMFLLFLTVKPSEAKKHLQFHVAPALSILKTVPQKKRPSLSTIKCVLKEEYLKALDTQERQQLLSDHVEKLIQQKLHGRIQIKDKEENKKDNTRSGIHFNDIPSIIDLLQQGKAKV